jgi:hypothetical protein
VTQPAEGTAIPSNDKVKGRRRSTKRSTGQVGVHSAVERNMK